MIGGAKRDRTVDLLRARQALSQLSYSPLISKPLRLGFSSFPSSQITLPMPQHMSGNLTQKGTNLVGLGRLELPTSPLSGVRSNQLSYRPISISNFKLSLKVA